MAHHVAQIDPLRLGLSIVDKNGGPTPLFMRAFNSLFRNSNVLNEDKQDADLDLTKIAALTGTGLAVRTTEYDWALRTLSAPAAGLTITNPAGVAGNPAFALANDLAALEALSGTHTIYYRSAADTWTAVTIGTGLDFTGATLSATGTGATTANPVTFNNGGVRGGIGNDFRRLGCANDQLQHASAPKPQMRPSPR
jgi:hypothetical protein